MASRKWPDPMPHQPVWSPKMEELVDRHPLGLKPGWTQVLTYLRELRKVPCAHCGATFPPECMDFHHQHGRKSFSLSNARGRNWGEIYEEIRKCIVLCSNCHRVVTAQEAVRRHQLKGTTSGS